jgi:hypothetical protein
MMMILMTVEKQEKLDGTFDTFMMEITPTFEETTHCRLATVRFFHKRNTCKCLEEIYSKLKKTTVRKMRCYYCHELKDSSEVKLCSRCKFVPYGSRDCQLAHFPSHKKTCRLFRDIKGKKMNETDSMVSSFNEIDLS